MSVLFHRLPRFGFCTKIGFSRQKQRGRRGLFAFFFREKAHPGRQWDVLQVGRSTSSGETRQSKRKPTRQKVKAKKEQ